MTSSLSRLAVLAATVGLSLGAHANSVFNFATQVGSGYGNSCAVTNAGAVRCWGNPTSGALGDGAFSFSPVPNTVVGISGAARVLAGSRFACALTGAGGVKCWGNNETGEVGDATNTLRRTPVDVVGLTSGVSDLSVGESHACAVTTGGAAKCWGWNSFGQLGDGTKVNKNTPTNVTGLSSGVAAISAGASHTCVLTTGGAVKCWGQNGDGQLGNGSVAESLVPADVPSLASGVTGIELGGAHSCAVVAGGLKCWGLNASGQLGDNSTNGKTTPTDVPGLGSGVSAVSAGGHHTCALLATGGVKCWGQNTNAQVGDGTLTNRLLPVDLPELSAGVTSLSAGLNHSCAIQSSTVICWGQAGSVGGRYLGQRSFAADSPGLDSGVASVSGGTFFLCALTTGGGVKCRGDNAEGQLGNGTTTAARDPVDVTGLTAGVSAISGGNSHMCALTSGGGVRCWGSNDFGQLGDGSTTDGLTAVNVTGLASGAIAVASGGTHSCAIVVVGGVKCWGRNTAGELGNGTSTNSPVPVDVSGLGSGVTRIALGSRHSCALLSSGAVKCWGAANLGQVGDGDTINRAMPVDVVGLASGVTSIAAQLGDHTCALMSDTTMRCWGGNSHTLGDGTTINRSSPVAVVGALGVAAIAVGAHSSCLVNGSGGVSCWGANGLGVLGNFGRTASTPSPAVGLQSGVTSVGFSRFEMCAIVAGVAKCTGMVTEPFHASPVAAMVPVTSDLVVEQVAVPAGAFASGRDIKFTWTVTANGPDLPLTNVTFSVPLTGLDLIWSGSTSGCAVASGTLTCTFGTLMQAQAIQVALRPQAGGTLNNTVTGATAQADPDLSNNVYPINLAIATSPPGVPVSRYRLYSPVTLEHLFTTDLNEYNTLGGFPDTWTQEGVSGKVLDNPGSFNGIQGVPYYRLYDTQTRWHHWTTDANEYYTLGQFPNWNQEGVDGWILPSATTGATQLYRLNYPHIPGLHHWTIDENEYTTLINQYGWIGEPGAGFVVQ